MLANILGILFWLCQVLSFNSSETDSSKNVLVMSQQLYRVHALKNDAKVGLVLQQPVRLNVPIWHLVGQKRHISIHSWTWISVFKVQFIKLLNAEPSLLLCVLEHFDLTFVCVTDKQGQSLYVFVSFNLYFKVILHPRYLPFGIINSPPAGLKRDVEVFIVKTWYKNARHIVHFLRHCCGVRQREHHDEKWVKTYLIFHI